MNSNISLEPAAVPRSQFFSAGGEEATSRLTSDPSSRLRSRSSGSGRPGSPGLLLLPAAVDGLGAGPKLSEPQSTDTQLEVLRDLPSTRPDVFQPLDGCLGQRKVADGRARLHPHLTATHGWEVPLRPDHHLVLAGVQQPPVVAVRG